MIDFYDRPEWKALRYEALRKYGFKCMACNRTREHGVVLHVDHIKPKANFPELALDINNLQVLCADCNIGKSNRYADDFRPVSQPTKQKMKPPNKAHQRKWSPERRKRRAMALVCQRIKKRLARAENAGDFIQQQLWMSKYIAVMRSMKNLDPTYDQ